MTELVSSVADKIDRAVQRVTPFAYRVRRTGRRWMRRALRKPRSVSEGPNLLPLLIQVLASFTKADGVIMEEEIDSSLGLLRAATVVPASALRAAGPCRDGTKTGRATEHRTQDHARRSALRSDLASWFETGRGGGVLFVHVADGHGCAGDRHRLSTQRVRGLRPVYLSAWS